MRGKYGGEMIVEDVEVAQQVVEIPSEQLQQAVVPALHGEPKKVFPEHRQHVVILHTCNITSKNLAGVALKDKSQIARHTS